MDGNAYGGVNSSIPHNDNRRSEPSVLARTSPTDPPNHNLGEEIKRLDDYVKNLLTNLQVHEQAISPVLLPVPPGTTETGSDSEPQMSPAVAAIREIRRRVILADQHLCSLTNRTQL